MYLGNIITTTKLDLGEKFNIITNKSDAIPNIPTLVIGRRKALKYIDFLDTMNKVIDENTFWTYAKKESRNDFEQDLEKFIDFCYGKITNKVQYIFVDVIQYRPSVIKKIIKKIYKISNPVAYIHDNNMIYLYGDGYTFGVDLELIKFTGYDSDKIKTKVQSLCGGRLLDSEILIKYKDYLSRLKNGLHYIPYLYFKDYE